MLNTIKRALGLGSDPILGSISLFPGNRGLEHFFECNGRLLDCGKYTALYSILGHNYGGSPDKFNFGIPKLEPVGNVKYYICYSGTYPRFQD